MIQDVIIKDLKRNFDQRGWLIETYREDEIDSKYHPVMSYVSMTKPGVVRGPHEHQDQTDLFVFIGPGDFELHLWDNRPDSSTFKKYFHQVFGQNKPASVLVPPGVIHGYKNISKVDAVCINYPNRLYAGKDKRRPVDEIRHENQKDSQFIIP
ncbi:MAG: dTDP-4-dehydrorhamnose 3,5-epimerase [Candidatus Moranbacteria bacterium]|nr:dTDP-4-dehydrorhamnose 3,5-epimerase [Candidatus Moranbacteria bacterium]